MTPTCKLRFVKRDFGGTGPYAKILQQWWNADDEHPEDCKGLYGEWRDVEVEEPK